MTSKEDFIKLRDLFYVDWLDEDFDDVGVWNNLEKDLQILEILKKKAYYYSVNENPKVASIEIHITTLDETFDKVEEWLDDER